MGRHHLVRVSLGSSDLSAHCVDNGLTSFVPLAGCGERLWTSQTKVKSLIYVNDLLSYESKLFRSLGTRLFEKEVLPVVANTRVQERESICTLLRSDGRVLHAAAVAPHRSERFRVERQGCRSQPHSRARTRILRAATQSEAVLEARERVTLE